MLSKSFGRLRAVDGVDLRVPSGQIMVLLGRIGAGKSTLLRMLAGYLLPSSGQMRIAGLDLRRQRLAAQRCLGYMPPASALYGDMRVRAFLRFVASLRGLDGLDRDRRMGDIGRRLKLDEVMGVPLSRLPPDWRWRVGLGQALLHEPEVLLLDEPGAGLDDRQRRELHTLLDAQSHGRSVLIASRQPGTAMAGCDRVAVMHRGRVLVDATPTQLLAESRYHGAVSFTAAHAAVARQALARLDGVMAIETDVRSGRTTVFAKPAAAILEPVLATLRALEVGYSEIQLERGRLADVLDQLAAKAEARAA
ncbi:MAG TPA: ABC transporter ATP-binding protein [Rhodanobacteraceae bacterium]|nr:ABC transporter ATP-binding protein [Rhodanobacteraceae bacterium]